MVLKLFGGAVVVCTSTIIGCCYAAGMHKRIVFLENIGHDIILLKSKIEERKKLVQAFRELADISDCSVFWNDWAKNADRFGIKNSCERSLGKLAYTFNLHKTDIRTINMLAGALGTTDIDAQLQHIDYISSMIDILCRNARADYDKNCRIYKTGGILLGIVTVLIMI